MSFLCFVNIPGKQQHFTPTNGTLVHRFDGKSIFPTKLRQRRFPNLLLYRSTHKISARRENLSTNTLYLALINRAGGLYGRILTEVVSTDRTQWGLCTRPRSRFSHTDRLSSVNKMFIIWQKQEQFNSFNVTGRGDKLGYLPFTRENRKFRLENQMVRCIPFGKLQKIWAVIRGDAIFLLFEVSLADVDIFYSDSLSRNLAFNRFMFMPEISNRMVFVNGKQFS